ncbi:MAG: OmpA family protein [Burkholderiaceae bacterium]|nr:OmpA family protein [Burkholderiaceae bacterium]
MTRSMTSFMRLPKAALFACLLGLSACSTVSLDDAPAPIEGNAINPVESVDRAGAAQAQGLGSGAGAEQGIRGGRVEEKSLNASSGALQVGDDGVPYAAIYFGFDSIEIARDYDEMLQKVANYMRLYDHQSLAIEGNTDDRGTSEYNLALGQRRAESVSRALQILGVPSQRMEAVSNGKEKPRNKMGDEAARAENRRADLFFVSKLP